MLLEGRRGLEGREERLVEVYLLRRSHCLNIVKVDDDL